MQYYLAPMEGITTYIYRNAYAHHFGDIDTYFTPFLASKKMNTKEVRDIHPDNNAGLDVVPQILTNHADEFLAIAAKIAEFGYTHVNLNLGCPSGTVTAKKRGAGFLCIPDELDTFLSEIFDQCPLSISIKTRLGYADLNEWEHLLQIFTKYPVKELMIHTRLREEFYTGKTHPECFAYAKQIVDGRFPLCYNGDIGSREDISAIPAISDSNVMIGRGLLCNPGFLSAKKDKQTLLAFHDEILTNYQSIMSGDSPVLFKMKDLWTYMSTGFTDSDRYLKKIRKANRITEYQSVVNALFREQELR